MDCRSTPKTRTSSPSLGCASSESEGVTLRGTRLSAPGRGVEEALQEGTPSYARVVLLGFAPAAHGANRTGRYFTGDRSGDFLFGALHRTGFSSSPVSRRTDDGLHLSGLWISAAVRCAPPKNKPTPAERDACLPYAARELELLPNAKAFVCLGAFAWDAALRLHAVRPKPKFAHGAEHALPSGSVLLGSYHPSQQNTFTGVLTPPMLEAVFLRARELAEKGWEP